MAKGYFLSRIMRRFIFFEYVCQASVLCFHGMRPSSFGPCLSEGYISSPATRKSLLRFMWYYKLAVRRVYSCVLYPKRKNKCVSQIVYSLQFKQSSLLAGYHNKNLQKQRCLQCILILLASYLEGCYIVLL